MNDAVLSPRATGGDAAAHAAWDGRHHLVDAAPAVPAPAPSVPAARQHFCYLIANDLGTVKTHTYIGCSRWPYQRLRAHNRELPGGPKNTKAAGESGAWRLRLIIGPFKADAKRFKLQWRVRSRGITSRARRGLALAREWGVAAYIVRDLYDDVRAEPGDGADSGDEEGAPAKRARRE